MKTRFAPSPTGTLHVGNIRTALQNYLLAARHGGRFMLRLDDTDAARSTDIFAEAIRGDLDTLGLAYDEEVRQSDRFDAYEQAFDRLRDAGRVYACYETPEELELRRKVLLGRGLPPIYERPDDSAPGDADGQAVDGRKPHWRFRLDHDHAIEWDDGVRGRQHFEPATISDPVIRRADGSWLYMLPSSVDDAQLGITHVVRGEDHVTNSAIQLQMFDALGAQRPSLAHTALIVGDAGKLSKREGADGVAALKERGLEPMALLSVLARIGTSQPVEPIADLDALAAGFSLDIFGRAPARFDWNEVAQVNARLLHQMDYAAVAARLPEGMDEAAWLAVRGNLSRLDDAGDFAAILSGDITPPAMDAETKSFCAQAAMVAGRIDYDADAWKTLTGALKDETGRKGKALFLPLRQALTGQSSGPEMAALLPLIGRERAVARLQKAAGQ